MVSCSAVSARLIRAWPMWVNATIAAQITPGDRDSRYRAWTAFGSRLTEQADAARDAGHRVSASLTWFSTGQGKQLFDHLTCPKDFRLFTRAGAPKATARAWHPSCSEPQPSTGLMRTSHDPTAAARPLARGC